MESWVGLRARLGSMENRKSKADWSVLPVLAWYSDVFFRAAVYI